MGTTRSRIWSSCCSAPKSRRRPIDRRVAVPDSEHTSAPEPCRFRNTSASRREPDKSAWYVDSRREHLGEKPAFRRAIDPVELEQRQHRISCSTGCSRLNAASQSLLRSATVIHPFGSAVMRAKSLAGSTFLQFKGAFWNGRGAFSVRCPHCRSRLESGLASTSEARAAKDLRGTRHYTVA